VKLTFRSKGPAAGAVEVRMANVPAQAVPGVYMLFVLDKKGVPSVGWRLDVK
jgi:hypothetical protein